MEDDARAGLLQMSPVQLADVARACNRYPNVEVGIEVENAEDLVVGDSVTVLVQLERDADEMSTAPSVHAPRFPKVKEEGWWIVVGDAKSNSLLCIKRITLQLKAKVKLEFVAPDAGEHAYTLYLMSDSYLGCDQELELPMTIAEGGGDDSDDDNDDDDDDDDDEVEGGGV